MRHPHEEQTGKEDHRMLDHIKLCVPTLFYVSKRTRTAVYGEYAKQRQDGYNEPDDGVTLDISPDPLQSR